MPIFAVPFSLSRKSKREININALHKGKKSAKNIENNIHYT